MYQSQISTTTTTAKTNFANPDLNCNNENQHDNRQQQIVEYQQQQQQQLRKTNDNTNGFFAPLNRANINEETAALTSIPFPKFDEFNAIINSDEFLDFHLNKQEASLQLQQESFVGNCTTTQAQSQQQRDQQHFQQVNGSVFRAPESLRENNANTNVNIPKATEPRDNSSNIGLVNGFNRSLAEGQESLLAQQVQLDDEEGRRLQYLNQYQLMKETIYQETKSFFCDNFNASGGDNMDSNNHHANHQQQQQQPKVNNYNGASYRDIYENVTKQEKPHVEIVEQPAKCSLRFRYKCEGRSAGSLPGVSSTADNKTYPSIQVKNYTGRAVVVISCVTKDAPYLAHPHNIVGKEGCKKGTCTVVFNNDLNTIKSFSSLGIQCVKRKDIEESLSLRESIHVDPFRNGFAHKLSSSNIDLNVVRLCFQVFIEGSTPNKYDVPLIPVVSDPIHDKKAMSDLVITKLSHCTAPASGGREVILLCDRISRDDIQIRFFEERNDKLIWETYTELAPTDVHKQVAICFRTPKYFNENITQPVTAYVQLKRLSDNQVSEPRMFKFLPSESDEDMISRKRQKIHQLNQNLQHLHHHQHHHQQQQHQSNQQQQQQQAPCNIISAQNHLQPQSSIVHKQQQHPGRSSASPHSRIASPVTPVQGGSPAAPAIMDRRIQQQQQQQQGHSPTPVGPISNHHNQSNQQRMQNQDTYVIESLQQQQLQQSSVVRREIISNDGKVVRLVDRPSQHPLAQATSSNRDVAGHVEITDQNQQQQQRQQDDNNKAPLGLSLARIDSDQLMRADMAFNPNMNLDLGSSISIHLNGGGGGGGAGNGSSNGHHAATSIP